jgi:hypothetical protein
MCLKGQNRERLSLRRDQAARRVRSSRISRSRSFKADALRRLVPAIFAQRAHRLARPAAGAFPSHDEAVVGLEDNFDRCHCDGEVPYMR